jgi:hypothetical protein
VKDAERDELRREWRRLQSVDATVIDVHRIGGRKGRWEATVETALGRRASKTANTPGMALRRARRALGYEEQNDHALALTTEIPAQVALG